MIYIRQGQVSLVKGTPWVPRKRPQPMCSSTWLLIQMYPTDMSPVQWWSECYLMEDQYQVTIVMTRLLANCWMGVRKSAGKRGGTLHAHCQVFFHDKKIAHCGWSYECTTIRINVFERGIILLPGHSEAHLAISVLCQLQLELGYQVIYLLL